MQCLHRGTGSSEHTVPVRTSRKELLRAAFVLVEGIAPKEAD